MLIRRAAVSLGFPRLARAGAAAGLAVACLALNAAPTPAAADSVRNQEWWLQALHVTQAWQSTRAGGVTVAVLGTGVYPKQADLRGAVTTGPDYTNSSRVRGGPFWGTEGTAIASLIAGRGHGASAGAGIMGVAPAASILSVRVTLEGDDPLLTDANIGGGLPDAIARGIRYAVNHHASVIDLPLDPVTVPGSPGVGGSSAEKAAVAYALAHHVVLVAPAGDEGADADPVNFPASYKGVISVGAFDAQFNKASFSSRQPYVTLTGAGVGVIAASGPTGYAQMNSTAAASAVVAGVAALIRAQFPALSPAQVTKALTESARFGRPGGQLVGSGAGTVDAAAALAAAARMTEAVPSSGSSAVAASPGAQPPSAPAVHTSSHLNRTLLIDAGIAVAIFLLLAVPILTYGLRRRRRARAARLAEVRAAAQPMPRKPAAARHAATDSVEPDQHNYIPAPPNQGAPAAPSRPAALPPVPSPANSSPAVGAGAASRAGAGGNGIRPSGHPPWAVWGSENGIPGSGPPARAIPGSAFPAAGEPGLPTNPPPGPPGPAATGDPSGDGDLAALIGLAGHPGAGELPRRTAGPTGPEQAGPGGGVPGWNIPGAGRGPEPGAPGTTAGRPTGPQRPGGSRAPRITGRPPWEPAPEPAGEVPWGRSPMPQAGGARTFPTGPQRPEVPMPETPGSRRPEQSPWDAIAEEAWPGGPSSSRSPGHPSREQGPGKSGRGQGRGSRGGGRDKDSTTSQPIYVWNPGAATENLPAIKPGENNKQ
jgi:hypothetical protein